MKKMIFKIVFICPLLLLFYYLVQDVTGAQPIFDSYPWVRPIGMIFVCGILLYNFRRDILASKKQNEDI